MLVYLNANNPQGREMLAVAEGVSDFEIEKLTVNLSVGVDESQSDGLANNALKRANNEVVDSDEKDDVRGTMPLKRATIDVSIIGFFINA